MNNKVLCKKIENLRNTVHVRFPANGKYPKLISNPSFVPQKHLAKISVQFMKLKTSKLLINQFM